MLHDSVPGLGPPIPKLETVAAAARNSFFLFFFLFVCFVLRGAVGVHTCVRTRKRTIFPNMRRVLPLRAGAPAGRVFIETEETRGATGLCTQPLLRTDAGFGFMAGSDHPGLSPTLP